MVCIGGQKLVAGDVDPQMLVVGNKGNKVAQTNFWSSEFAQQGFCLLSGNAGDWRLLIPPSQDEALREFAAVQQATIEPSIVLPDHYDVVAEDGTASPYCLSLDPCQIDRRLEKKKCRLLVYSQDGLVANMPVSVDV